MYSVYGVENPLMDVIAHVDTSFLRRFDKTPGTMHLVEYDDVMALLKEIPAYKTVPGGSAANTARGIAWLESEDGRALRESIIPGGITEEALRSKPVFNGAIGGDERGDLFVSGMETAGVRSALVRKSTPTGTSVILVTPDGERTMNTFLGACRDFQDTDLDLALLAESQILYLTGYLWDTENQKKAANAASDFARQQRRRIPVAFDLADPFAVRRYAPQFREWIPGRVDILFGNREELSLLVGASCDEDCVAEATSLAPVVVMKIGAQGCLVGWDGKCEHVPGISVPRVDTTGAGDAFAAGFLFGRLAGAEPLTCARLANSVAARVVSREGCSYSD